ncbi:MAG TPA: hypothetical protein VIJ02_07955, partial [Thermoanaerobaculia bacterium]
FDSAAAWRRVRDAAELGVVWEGWLEDRDSGRATGERALRLVESNRGALGRTVEMLKETGAV